MVTSLNLSTAFDMVDHNILLNVLHHHCGITDKALQWFSNYLQPWYFKICVRNNYSRPQQLHFSVAQGSCSEANIFMSCRALINKVVPEDIIIYGFANNHSLWKSFPASDRQKEKCTKEKLKAIIATIKSWMDQMRLKLNADKTIHHIWFQNTTAKSVQFTSNCWQ